MNRKIISLGKNTKFWAKVGQIVLIYYNMHKISAKKYILMRPKTLFSGRIFPKILWLGFFLIFGDFESRCSYKSVAYKKTCIYVLQV